MRNNKMKGFTLVELLVVIAILAILATVSVVGYTSFIKSAYISNDENIAAQLNQFMVALKADSDGDFYDELQASGGKVTVDNVREITDYILNDSGLGTLVPQSAEYGYHFYFDLDAQEYVLIGDDDPRILGMSPLGRLFAGAISQSQTAYPESCFTEGGRYFLVETGTKLADVVALFKTVTDLESLNNLFTEVDGFRTNKGEQLKALVDFVKDSVFVTKDGTFVYDVTMAHKHLFIFPGATQIGNTKVSFVNTANTASINAEHPLITVDKDITITVPAGVTPLSNSMIIGGGNNATIVIDANGWNADPTTKLSELADANFTTADTTIVVAGVEYKLVGGTKVYTKVADGDGDHVANLGYNGSPVTSFDITCAEDASSDKLLLDGNYLYVAYDYEGTITFGGTNFNNGGIVSSENLTWGDPSNGIIVKNADGTYKIGIIPDVGAEGGYAATITATAEAGGYEKSIQVYVVRPLDVTYTLEGELDGVITYNGNNNKYVFSVPTVTFNPNGKVTCNDDVTITTSGDLFSIDKEEGRYVLTLNKNVEGGFDGKSQTFTVTAGTGDGKITSTKTISVNDVSAEPFSIVAPFDTTFTTIVDGTTYQTPYRVGNKNTVTLNTFFTTTKAASSTTLTVSTISGTATATATGMTEDGSLAVTNTAWNSDTNIPLSFSGTGVVALSLGGNTVRLEVVDGYNVKEYKDITSNNLSNKKNANLVFLKDIDMPSGDTTQLILNNAILFGNGFKFNVRTGYYQGSSGGITNNFVIRLDNGTLNNVYIEGRPLTDAGITKENPNSTCTVLSVGDNDIIANCFISGNGTPVRTSNSTIKIVNTTLSGGTIANLELRNCKVTLENLTTINQVSVNDVSDIEGNPGFGIVVWHDNVSNLDITIKGTLTQYNYAQQSDIESIDFIIADVVNVTDMIAEKIFKDPSVSDKFVSGGWVNMGIIIMDTSNVGSEDIHDLRTNNNYVSGGFSVGMQGVVSKDIFVYSLPASAVSTSKTNAPEYTNKGQYYIEASSSFELGDNEDPKDGTSDNNFCYIENGEVKISFNELNSEGNANSMTFYLNGFFTPEKLGKNLAITGVFLDGEDITEQASITFSESGNHVLTFTFEDGNNYHADGQYVVKYSVSIEISVTVVPPNVKHADFTFGSNNTSGTLVTVGNITYVMPDVTATSSTIASTKVGNQTIYMPIVNCKTDGNKTSYTSGVSWYMCFPVFDGVVTIVDYAGGVEGGASVTYNSSTQDVPTMIVNGQTIVKIAAVNPAEAFQYGSEGTAPTEPTVKNNKLVYTSPKMEGVNRSEYSLIIEYIYKDNAGAEYHYFVNYKTPKITNSVCVTPETLVTLADGTQKEIQYVTYEDMLLVWNFETGKYDVVPASIVMNHGYDNYIVTSLIFSDGTTVNTINGHGFYDLDNNKFVIIDENNVAKYIGHNFVKQDGDTYTTVALVDYTVKEEYTESWSILTAVYHNAILEGMLTLTPAEVAGSTEYLMPFVVVDMKYDEAMMQADIEKYGLYTYEEFADYITYEEFEALNLKYFKVAVGKGTITYEDIIYLLNYHFGK